MEAFDSLVGLPAPLLYLLLAVGAGLENVFPPVPADSFVILGGVLAGQGLLNEWIVFGATAGSNVVTALALYAVGHRYGQSFFDQGFGRILLNPRQLHQLHSFYERWGTPAIFFTRFLPGVRAVVPAFAGVARQPLRAVAPPIVAASAIWYGTLVFIGTVTGRNLETILGWLAEANVYLLAGTSVVVVGAVIAWWLTRRKKG